MNQSLAAFKRWRIQIFAITWLAYAAFYFTRKAFSVAKLGIAEDPSFMLDKAAMANLDAIYLAPTPWASLPGACSPTASARGWWCLAGC